MSIIARRPSVLLKSAAKCVLWILLVLNWRSLPFMWHLRVFRPVFAVHFNSFIHRIRNIRKSPALKHQEGIKWLDAMSPIGANPFDTVVTYKTWAGIDDIDFNLHLSNSSYSKTLDAARFKAALSWFPSFFRAGGWMALGANHYSFLREIPMLTKYEVRLSIAAWDNKWMFLIARYVTHTKPKPTLKPSTPSPPPDASDMFRSSLRIPSTAISGESTPLPSSSTKSSSPSGEAIKHLLSASTASAQEPDGATLHCVAVSELCFKHGRITVPPSIALAVNGFSRGPEHVPEVHFIPASPTVEQQTVESVAEDPLAQSSWTEADLDSKVLPPSRTYSSAPSPQAYSASNPPPHWHRIRSFRYDKQRLADFMRGGWKNVEQAEEWWIDALGGEVEARRARNWAAVKGVKEGIVGARGI